MNNQVTPITKFKIIAILSIVSFFFALVLAEVMLRFIKSPDKQKQEDIGDKSYRFYNGYFTHQPNTSFITINEDGVRNTIELDAYGLRNPSGVDKGVDVIMLGDSLLEANNTSSDMSLVGQLRSKGIRAYNAGMDGSSTFEEATLLRDHLDALDATAVVLVFSLGNDFRDNTFRNLPPPHPKRSTVAKTPLKEVVKGICMQLYLCKLVYKRFWLPYRWSYEKEPMGNYAIAEMIMLRVSDSRAANALKKTKEALSALNMIVKQRKARLIVVGVPSKSQVLKSFFEMSHFSTDSMAMKFAMQTVSTDFSWDRPDQLLAEICKNTGIEYIPLLYDFRKKIMAEKLYYYIDYHWTALGQQRAAEVIAEKILKIIGKKAIQN